MHTMSIRRTLLACLFFLITGVLVHAFGKPTVVCAQSNNCCSDNTWVWQNAGGDCGPSNKWTDGYNACANHQCGICQVPSVCGNGTCDPGEDAGKCAADCTTAGFSATPAPVSSSGGTSTTGTVCYNGSPTASSCRNGQKNGDRCTGFAGTCFANGTGPTAGTALCGCKPDVITSCDNVPSAGNNYTPTAQCVQGTSCNSYGFNSSNGGLGCQSGYVCCGRSGVLTPTASTAPVYGMSIQQLPGSPLVSPPLTTQTTISTTTNGTTATQTVTAFNASLCGNECTSSQVCIAGNNGYMCQPKSGGSGINVPSRTYVSAIGCDVQPATTATTARQFLCGVLCKWGGELVGNGQSCGGTKTSTPTPTPISNRPNGSSCQTNSQCVSRYCRPVDSNGNGVCEVLATPVATPVLQPGSNQYANNTVCTANNDCQSNCCANVTSAAGTTLRLCSVSTQCQIQPLPSNPSTLPTCPSYASALPGTNQTTQCTRTVTAGSVAQVLYQCNAGYKYDVTTSSCTPDATNVKILVTPSPTPIPTPIVCPTNQCMSLLACSDAGGSSLGNRNCTSPQVCCSKTYPTPVPPTALPATGRALNQTCTSNTQCASGYCAAISTTIPDTVCKVRSTPTPSPSPTPTPIPTPATGGLSQQCGTGGLCRSGLTCKAFSTGSSCLISTGQPCSDSTTCFTGYCRPASASTGPSVCAVASTPTPVPSRTPTPTPALKAFGATCRESAECQSTLECSGSICKKRNLQSCSGSSTGNSECASGFCRANSGPAAGTYSCATAPAAPSCTRTLENQFASFQVNTEQCTNTQGNLVYQCITGTSWSANSSGVYGCNAPSTAPLTVCGSGSTTPVSCQQRQIGNSCVVNNQVGTCQRVSQIGSTLNCECRITNPTTVPTPTPRPTIPSIASALNSCQGLIPSLCSITPGCAWNGSTCGVQIGNLQIDCSTFGTRQTCIANADSCQWQGNAQDPTLSRCVTKTLTISTPTPSPTPVPNALSSCSTTCYNPLGCACQLGCVRTSTSIFNTCGGTAIAVTPTPRPTSAPLALTSCSQPCLNAAICSCPTNCVNTTTTTGGMCGGVRPVVLNTCTQICSGGNCTCPTNCVNPRVTTRGGTCGGSTALQTSVGGSIGDSCTRDSDCASNMCLSESGAINERVCKPIAFVEYGSTCTVSGGGRCVCGEQRISNGQLCQMTNAEQLHISCLDLYEPGVTDIASLSSQCQSYLRSTGVSPPADPIGTATQKAASIITCVQSIDTAGIQYANTFAGCEQIAQAITSSSNQQQTTSCVDSIASAGIDSVYQSRIECRPLIDSMRGTQTSALTADQQLCVDTYTRTGSDATLDNACKELIRRLHIYSPPDTALTVVIDNFDTSSVQNSVASGLLAASAFVGGAESVTGLAGNTALANQILVDSGGVTGLIQNCLVINDPNCTETVASIVAMSSSLIGGMNGLQDLTVRSTAAQLSGQYLAQGDVSNAVAAGALAVGSSALGTCAQETQGFINTNVFTPLANANCQIAIMEITNLVQVGADFGGRAAAERVTSSIGSSINNSIDNFVANSLDNGVSDITITSGAGSTSNGFYSGIQDSIDAEANYLARIGDNANPVVANAPTTVLEPNGSITTEPIQTVIVDNTDNALAGTADNSIAPVVSEEPCVLGISTDSSIMTYKGAVLGLLTRCRAPVKSETQIELEQILTNNPDELVLREPIPGERELGSGFNGTVTVYGDTARKVFRQAADETQLFQIAVYRELDGTGGIPQFRGTLVDEGGNIIGFDQQFISGISLDDCPQCMNQAYAEEIMRNLEDLHRISAHQDIIHFETLADGSEIPRLNAEHILFGDDGRVYFLDAAGANSPSVLTDPDNIARESENVYQALWYLGYFR